MQARVSTRSACCRSCAASGVCCCSNVSLISQARKRSISGRSLRKILGRQRTCAEACERQVRGQSQNRIVGSRGTRFRGMLDDDVRQCVTYVLADGWVAKLGQQAVDCARMPSQVIDSSSRATKLHVGRYVAPVRRSNNARCRHEGDDPLTTPISSREPMVARSRMAATRPAVATSRSPSSTVPLRRTRRSIAASTFACMSCGTWRPRPLRRRSVRWAYRKKFRAGSGELRREVRPESSGQRERRGIVQNDRRHGLAPGGSPQDQSRDLPAVGCCDTLA